MKRPDITPGEWSKENQLLRSEQGEFIASFRAPSLHISRPLEKTMEANAQAIAALPALLDALEHTFPVIDDQSQKHPAPEWDNIRRTLKEALTLAGYKFDT